MTVEVSTVSTALAQPPASLVTHSIITPSASSPAEVASAPAYSTRSKRRRTESGSGESPPTKKACTAKDEPTSLPIPVPPVITTSTPAAKVTTPSTRSKRVNQPTSTVATPSERQTRGSAARNGAKSTAPVAEKEDKEHQAEVKLSKVMTFKITPSKDRQRKETRPKDSQHQESQLHRNDANGTPLGSRLAIYMTKTPGEAALHAQRVQAAFAQEQADLERRKARYAAYLAQPPQNLEPWERPDPTPARILHKQIAQDRGLLPPDEAEEQREKEREQQLEHMDHMLRRCRGGRVKRKAQAREYAEMLNAMRNSPESPGPRGVLETDG